MAIVDYLGSQSGVQYNGIQVDDDTSGVDLQNVLLIGEFKRGPFNRPFKVTKETMEVKLSYDYNNPYYTFLEDAFEHGAEYIWVMRVSREQVVEPEPIWGDWILNSGVTVNTNGIAHYTAYKTNQREYYDSYANLDLTAAIVRSLHDGDMQQWQAVKDAANELTGVTDWVLDPANNQIKYKEQPSDPSLNPNFQYKCTNGSIVNTTRECGEATLLNPPSHISGATSVVGCSVPENVNQDFACAYKWPSGFQSSFLAGTSVTRVEALPEEEQKTLPLDVVAQKVISNVSSSNQAISLLAEVYLDTVANSIYNADESKQFVKLLDIEPDFEANKTQR